MQCLECNTQTKNPKFCSRNCAAKYNNRVNPKRRLTNQCRKCNELVHKPRKFCLKCKPVINQDMTLKQAKYTQQEHCNVYTLVRIRARAIAKKLGLNKCFCGYDKHVEIAHKKAISSFPEDTLLSVINHPDNLMALCPNHHWEYDNANR